MNVQSLARMVVCTSCLAAFPPSYAATVALDRLNLDSASVQLGFPVTGTQTVNYTPPFVWKMGTYMGNLASGTIASGVNYSLDSTSLYGQPATSGTVDTSLGTIDLHPTDLHLTLSGLATASFDLWHPSSTVNADSYDPVTHLFSYGWSDSALISGIPTDYSIMLTGTAATVPVPAAAWLFGSGLVGLVGVSRQKNAV